MFVEFQTLWSCGDRARPLLCGQIAGTRFICARNFYPFSVRVIHLGAPLSRSDEHAYVFSYVSLAAAAATASGVRDWGERYCVISGEATHTV